MPSVEFSKDNMMKCICGSCPVQTESACAAEKNAMIKTAMESGMESMPAEGAVPGLYCATGVAACDDLDLSKHCICPGCPVLTENGLTQNKYCERGNAETIG
jgi:hypothetical protein